LLPNIELHTQEYFLKFYQSGLLYFRFELVIYPIKASP